MSRTRWIAVGGAAVVLASVIVAVTVGSGGADTPQQLGNTPNSTAPSSTAPTSGGTTSSDTTTSTQKPPVNGVDLPAGLTLAAGSAGQPVPAAKVVDGEPLDADQIAAVTDRLPDWKDAGKKAPFRWPTKTTPKPRGGTTVDTEFPGPTSSADRPTPEQTPTGPLKVLRMQPQGTVEIAPFVSITFNQPMVPVGTVGSLADTEPATIAPATPGAWQWIGTSTVRFVADRATNGSDRMPMATEYTVTVPAGLESASGQKLAKAASFTFDTPAPRVQDFGPRSQSMPLDPVFVAVFDQKVDPDVVLKTITVTADDAPQQIRLATDDEIAADSQAAGVVDTAPEGRAVAFRADADLPADAAIEVAIGKGTASAEGPRTTGSEQAFSGRTHAELTLRKKECGWGGRCEPGSSLVMEFSNRLDVDAFDPSGVRISPELPGGAAVSAAGNRITIEGATQPDTNYTVTVAAGLTDAFDQELAEAASSSFDIGPASTRLDPFPQPVTTLDPMADTPTIGVNTVNRTEFRLRVLGVTPKDWPAYRKAYVEQLQGNRESSVTVPDWPVLTDRVVTIDGGTNRTVRTTIDLADAMGTKNAVVVIEPTDAEKFDDETRWQNRPTMTWVQSTTIGLDVINDDRRLQAWATDLRDGTPLPDVTVGLLASSGAVDPEQSATTDEHGLAEMALGGGAFAILASSGDQTALIPSEMWDRGWRSSPQQDRLLWYVNDDRQTYRPGETVSLKGWVRRQVNQARSSLATIPTGSITYEAYDGYGNKIASGKAELSKLGGFDAQFKVPDGANTGQSYLQLRASGVSGVQDPYGMHSFTIADFRTPDFEVATHLDGTEPAVVGDDLTVAADATYYAGGPLGDAQVDWQVRTASASYAPPGWDRYSFGIWTPWWDTAGQRFGSGFEPSSTEYGYGYYPEDCCGPVDPDATKVDTFTGTTDGAGSDYLQILVGDLGEKYTGLPVTLTAQASVTDVNRQQIAGTADLLVHPAAAYVGLESDSTFVKQDTPLTVQAIATDIDGKVAPGLAIDMRLAKVTTTWSGGTSTDTETDVTTCEVTSAADPVECTFEPKAGGTYRITATVTDADGRISRSQLTRWVAGDDGRIDSSVAEQQLTLVPDKQDYQPGDTAEVLVQSPIATGTGMLTITQHGIVSTSTFPVADGTAVVAIPITDQDVPGLTASIEVVGAAPRQATDSGGTGDDAEAEVPAYATGGIGLPVSREDRTLTVTATPREKTVAPGGTTTLDVTVTDHTGKPVSGSEFEVVVADEAVLAVGGYELPDPVQAFYPDPQSWLTTFFGRSQVMLADPPKPGRQGGDESVAESSAAASAGTGSDTAGGETAADAEAYPMSTEDGAATAAAGRTAEPTPGAPIAERSNFEPLALFEPSTTTDASGKASIDVPLPDNLTRYRVMVVAVAGDDAFGTTESSITAGLPVTVRPSGPAFLNFGDSLELPVLVQNTTDRPLQADVVLQTSNLTADGPGGKRVTVPADGRVEVRFPVSAEQAGTAKFRAAVVAGDAADAATVDLPVYTPATTETFATYGIVDGGESAGQPVTAPKDVIAEYGGLQVSTSSTALQQLTDAVGYLADYEYESADGLAAQIIAIGTIGDVLQEFSVPGIPSPDKLKALVGSGVTKLRALQNDDGGFAAWRRGDDSSPFRTIQATQALLVAKEYGTPVPQGVLDRALGYLKDIDQHFPEGATRETKDLLTAYALNVRMQAGQRDGDAAQAMVTDRGDELPLDAVAWLLPVVSDPTALLQRVGNAAVDNAGTVTFTNEAVDDAWTTLRSDVRTDALLLDALLAVDPDSDLNRKIVAGLMLAQRGGRWNNVQENTFALVALRHYYDTMEASAPDFVAGVWLGDRFAGEHTYSGRSTDRATVSVPTAELVKAGDTAVTVGNDGTGTLYYRIGLQTAPADLDLDPLDRGFVVSRSYHAVDDPDDVTKDADGWHIKAGARVRVEIELVAHSAQSDVALVDPLPAGLQPMNPDLATTPKDYRPAKQEDAESGSDQIQPVWWPSTWFQHQNLRDDRAEAVTSWLQGGVYSYSYQATATTPGSFVAPPARAEQIYAPETFGRSGTDRVVIEG